MIDHKISISAIQGCLSTLAVVDVEKLDDVLVLLEGQDVTPEKLEKALNMLASAKTERMQEMWEILAKHQISQEAANRSLTALTRAKPREVDEILTLFEKNGVSPEIREEMWTVAVADRKNFHDMRRVFDLDYVPKNKENHARKVLKRSRKILRSTSYDYCQFPKRGSLSSNHFRVLSGLFRKIAKRWCHLYWRSKRNDQRANG